MGVSITSVDKDRASDFYAAMGKSFGFDIEDPKRLEIYVEMMEWDRSRAAVDGDEIVGTAGAFSLDLTVPGSTMPCGGTTVVSVLPTHRRQGILRSMIDSHLADVRDREEPIAGLWASDSAIYGRFGYGCAAYGTDVEITREHTQFHRLAPTPAPVRLLRLEEAKDALPPFYDRVRRDIPGFYARSEPWWRLRRFRDESDGRNGATAYRYAVTETGGRVTGFVQYRFKDTWSDGHGTGEVRIRELVAEDPAGWAGLWRFALDHDLTAKILAPDRSTRDPLFEMLAGTRRAARKVGDSLWIRIMDVAKALEGRSYSATANVVVQFHDPLDASTSIWRLDLTPDGSSVTPSTDEPDVVMDLEDLGACFLGEARFDALGRAGRLSGDRGHLLALDHAFTWSPGPWCPEVF